MGKTLYITDLDGTLLNTNDSVNPYSIDIINNLLKKGLLFTYATARSLVSASVVTKGLQINMPVIVYNGALIINPVTQEVLSSVHFTSKEAAFVQKQLKQLAVSPIVYAYIGSKECVSWDITSENDGIKRYISIRQGDRRLRPLENSTGLYDGESFYFTCIGEHDELLPVYKLFNSDSRFHCTLQQELYRPEYWCEIMPAKATKAEAILKLKEIYNCDKIVSFGDAINDIPMFEISDECYAVSNAVSELKAIATGIIEGNDEDGVAKWLSDTSNWSDSA